MRFGCIEPANLKVLSCLSRGSTVRSRFGDREFRSGAGALQIADTPDCCDPYEPTSIQDGPYQTGADTVKNVDKLFRPTVI